MGSVYTDIVFSDGYDAIRRQYKETDPIIDDLTKNIVNLKTELGLGNDGNPSLKYLNAHWSGPAYVAFATEANRYIQRLLTFKVVLENNNVIIYEYLYDLFESDSSNAASIKRFSNNYDVNSLNLKKFSDLELDDYLKKNLNDLGQKAFTNLKNAYDNTAKAIYYLQEKFSFATGWSAATSLCEQNKTLHSLCCLLGRMFNLVTGNFSAKPMDSISTNASKNCLYFDNIRGIKNFLDIAREQLTSAKQYISNIYYKVPESGVGDNKRALRAIYDIIFSLFSNINTVYERISSAVNKIKDFEDDYANRMWTNLLTLSDFSIKDNNAEIISSMEKTVSSDTGKSIATMYGELMKVINLQKDKKEYKRLGYSDKDWQVLAEYFIRRKAKDEGKTVESYYDKNINTWSKKVASVKEWFINDFSVQVDSSL